VAGSTAVADGLLLQSDDPAQATPCFAWLARLTSSRPIGSRRGNPASRATRSSACRSARRSAPAHDESARPLAGGDIQAAIDACRKGKSCSSRRHVHDRVDDHAHARRGAARRGLAGAPTGNDDHEDRWRHRARDRHRPRSDLLRRHGGQPHRDSAKGDDDRSVGAAAATFSAGDLALVDVVDDSTCSKAIVPTSSA
jgi:hypothetical protein